MSRGVVSSRCEQGLFGTGDVTVSAIGLRRLAALAACASGERITQRELAARLGISLGLANGLLRRMEQEGLISISEAGGARSLRYSITARGQREMGRLNRLMAEQAGRFLEGPRMLLEERARVLRRMGRRRALLCGKGPLADVAASALLNAGMRLSGIVALDVEGTRVRGIRVIPVAESGRIGCDVAVGVTARDAAALRRAVPANVPVIAFLAYGAGGAKDRA